MSGRSKSVFVVDDNADILSTFALILKRNGFEVQTFEDGGFLVDESVSLPDVMIIDVNLPTISGLRLAPLIRSRPDSRNVLLIAITGDSRPGMRKRCLDAGFDLFFDKPFRFKTVCEHIEILLAGNSANSRANAPGKSASKSDENSIANR